jgi:hypothetical protein
MTNSSREFGHFWRHYESNTQDGNLPSLSDLGLKAGEPAASRLLDYWNANSHSFYEHRMNLSDEQKLLDVCLQFLQEARQAQVAKVREYLEMGVPINVQHPRHKITALHCATFENVDEDYRKLARFLLDNDHEINFLLEDSFGRNPWHCAMLFGFDKALTAEIYERTKMQADKIGLDLKADLERKLDTWKRSTWFAALNRNSHIVPEQYEPN